MAIGMPMQAGIVRGTVIDSATKEPVQGVVVSTAGGSVVAITAVQAQI